MADSITTFQEEHPSLESYYRSVILFGRNVASYKFALSKSLLDIAPTGKNVVTLDELATPFASHICEHLKHAPKQQTGRSSRFLDACRAFNQGEISEQVLHDTTVQYGFKNVIDAFHYVNQGNIPVQFYQKDYQGRDKKIILTDELFKLAEIKNFDSLEAETEARWNLVETAWELGTTANLLAVNYDEQGKMFYVVTGVPRSVTPARKALNGYQKGKCFYCFDDISIDSHDENCCDVDHFFPFTLSHHLDNTKVNINGVWNLVLACQRCNRGLNGKFAKIASRRYLKRLHKRNEFLISSHHPLRETLMNQTGAFASDRVNFLNKMDAFAIGKMIHRWETIQVGQEIF